MARETTLVLVRHGEIVRPVGTSNFDEAPLSSTGEGQVTALAHHWPAPRPDVVYTSDLLRSVQTGRILSAMLGAPLDLRLGLREWTPGTGNLPEREFLAIEARCWNDLDFVPPSGETLLEAQRRINQTLRDIARSHRGGCVAVAGHGATFSLFTSLVQGIPPTRERKNTVPFAGYAVVRYQSRFTVLSDFRTVV